MYRGLMRTFGGLFLHFSQHT